MPLPAHAGRKDEQEMSEQGTPPTRGGRSALAARPRGSMYAGFTLIEILVVIGIIAC
jgi:type II secretory pathway pseudopilin PulG